MAEAVQTFAVQINAHLDRVDTAVAGLTEDFAFFTKTIEDLQNSPGTFTPADQASLDALQARVSAAADKLDALDASRPVEP